MLVYSFTGLAEGLSEQQRLQVVAALLGVLVFGVIVLLAERRNHTHEVVPPGRTGALAGLDPPRQVHRPPATAVPIASAREAADPAEPYPVPFISGAEESAGAPAEGPG